MNSAARPTAGSHGEAGTGPGAVSGSRSGPGTPDTAKGTGTGPRGVRLTLRGAAVGRGSVPVLDRIGLDVEPGEILTVVGPSGCGKSTLLRTLAGLLPALDGEVHQDGEPITGPHADRALVFQDDALLPWRTVRANVELPLAIRGVARAERRERAEHWLTRVGLDGHGAKPPHRLSGGQRQRVQLARALVAEPRAVLMDEPFGALDAQTRAATQQLLVDVWRGTGATVVFVTHDVDEAVFLGDRVALLSTGRVLDVPRPRERAAHGHPATVALRREVLASLTSALPGAPATAASGTAPSTAPEAPPPVPTSPASPPLPPPPPPSREPQ
ncbi:ABC transporter ATP-binding protein [Streptomyces sp. DT24]|uniref:ABC transporter ATP-binding protein n=1 Tax=Streptomyces sp. DT24 TaxID=3416520 RepID=UPI003CFB7BB1